MANTDVELGQVNANAEAVQLLLAYEEKGHLIALDEEGHGRVRKKSIFKVPSVQRDINPSSYNPKVVSIGPLHRKAKNLQAMEERKATYVHNLLACSRLPREETLEACVQKVTASINDIKESYGEIKSYSDAELAKMMVIDGFFILEFVYNYSGKHRSDVLLTQSIIEDLVLLENQIPFFVLEDLFECTISKRELDASLIGLILKVLNSVLLDLNENIVFQGTTTPDHILSLLHMCYHPENSIPTKYLDSDVHSATELDRAGMKFKRLQDPKWPLVIEFVPSRFGCFPWSLGKPTLTMPVMCLNDFTESITRNLIVYEQSSSHVPDYITSYVSVLDSLVHTKKDIALLRESGVLINCIGSNEEAANIINRIKQNIPSKSFFYCEQWDELDRYYSSYWSQLRRKYFSNPWSMIALLAGIVQFALLIVQTIFTIKQAV